MKEEKIRVGKYKVKRKKSRLQGETIKKAGAASGFKKVVGFLIAIVVIITTIAIGLSMGRLEFSTTDKFTKAKASEQTTKNQPYKSMAVIERSSGRLLSGYHSEDKLPMASTTKIMTAIVTIEKMGDLTQEFEVPEQAVGVEGSSMYLKHGEKLTLLDYLYGLILPSGNDSAVALSIIVSGSEEKFAELMNEYAQKIGAVNTHFVTASGLHHKDHYTTSHDLALITNYAMNNKTFREIVGSRTKTIKGETPDTSRHLKNKQKLMDDETLSAEGITVTGVKSGFTPEAGRCLVTSAIKDGMEVIVVVLNAPEMFLSTADILKEIYADYSLVEVIASKKHLTTAEVLGSDDSQVNLYIPQGFIYPLTREERLMVKTTYDYPTIIQAPIKKDQQVGKVVVSLSDLELFSSPILTIEAVEEVNINSIIVKLIKKF